MEEVYVSPLGTISFSRAVAPSSVFRREGNDAFITENKKGQPVASGCPNAFPDWNLANWPCQHPEGFPCESLWGIRVVSRPSPPEVFFQKETGASCFLVGIGGSDGHSPLSW